MKQNEYNESLRKISESKEEYNKFLKLMGYDKLMDLRNSSGKVNIEIYSKYGEKYIPQYKTQGASGMDLYAAITRQKTIKPFEVLLVPTGIHVNIPSDYEFQLRPRSSLALKQQITLINCVGTIDDDYTGEIMVPLINLSKNDKYIKPWERIAQMVLSKVDKCEWIIVDSTENFESKDRTGGFGSTGKH